jgi:hypothetical protein
VKPVSKNDVPANGVEAELQRRDYAEVAASSPEHPEQVRVLGCARRHETPVRSDHLCADQAVGGELMLAPPRPGRTPQSASGASQAASAYAGSGACSASSSAASGVSVRRTCTATTIATATSAAPIR